MTVGFVALWKNTPCEYHASEQDEWATTERIQNAFALGRERGNRTHGLYNGRWSSAWQYLTFWLSHDLSAVADTIADLERAGDFKFADSEHIVGRWVESGGYLTQGAWDEIPEPVEGESPPAGLFVAWRRTGSAEPRLTSHGGAHLSALETSAGLRMLGQFDCRFSTDWERFSFWMAPSIEVLEQSLAMLEQDGMLVGTETRAVVGQLDRYYRFGSHLQTTFPWLNEEVEGR